MAAASHKDRRLSSSSVGDHDGSIALEAEKAVDEGFWLASGSINIRAQCVSNVPPYGKYGGTSSPPCHDAEFTIGMCLGDEEQSHASDDQTLHKLLVIKPRSYFHSHLELFVMFDVVLLS